MPRGRADLRNHGAGYGGSWWRPDGYALLGRARCVAAERNGPDVLADECLPFGALAEADLQPTNRCAPVLFWRQIERCRTFRAREYSQGVMSSAVSPSNQRRPAGLRKER